MGWVRLEKSIWKTHVYAGVNGIPGMIYADDGVVRFDRPAGYTGIAGYNIGTRYANPAPEKRLKIRIRVGEYRSVPGVNYQPAEFINYQASPQRTVVQNTAAQGPSGAVTTFTPSIVSDDDFAGTWMPSYRGSLISESLTGGDEHFVHYIEVWDPDQQDAPPPSGGGGGGGGGGGATSRPADTASSLIPKPSHPIADGKPIDRIWYDALQRLASKTVSESRVVDIVQSQIPPPPDNTTTIQQADGIDVTGNRSDGYFVSLRQLIDTGVGDALWKFTRDAYGRVEGTQSATTDDLTEGLLNLYVTPDRVKAYQIFNRIDAAGDIRAAADGSLRITDGS